MEARAARDLWRDVAPMAGSPASPLVDRGSAAQLPRPSPGSTAPAQLPGVPPRWIGDRLPQLPRPSPGSMGDIWPLERQKLQRQGPFQKFFPLKGELPQVQKNCKKRG